MRNELKSSICAESKDLAQCTTLLKNTTLSRLSSIYDLTKKAFQNSKTMSLIVSSVQSIKINSESS